MLLLQLNNKTAVITGASSGIGAAIAKLFAKEGASVVLGARRHDKLVETAEEISRFGGAAAAVAGDVSNESYAKALVDTAVQRFGGLDIAINNASIVGPMDEADA